MTDKPAQPGTPSPSMPMVPAAAEATLAAGHTKVVDGGAVVPADAAPLAAEPSTSDQNVARARRRRDIDAGAVAEAHRMLLKELAAQVRAPFRRVLAELIGAAPTPEAVRRFADKYPDRWAQAVSIMGGLAGYERGVLEVNVFAVKSLSDADLMKRLAEVEQQLAAGRGPRVTGEVVDAVVVSDSVSPASPAAPAYAKVDAAPPISHTAGDPNTQPD